ncbi:MAG: SufS family cysteine desulfurase [Cellulomonadaceae bacterium]
MTTPESRSTEPDAELPITPKDLARLANQIYAALPSPQVTAPRPSPAPHSPVPPSPAPPTSVPHSPGLGLPGRDLASAWDVPAGTFAPAGPPPPHVWSASPGALPEPVAPADLRLVVAEGSVPITEVPVLTPDRGVFDVASIRRDFPILSETVRGRPLVWFDNAATTQKPRAVIDRLVRFYSHENSNIHRAAHELAARATDAYEDARQTVADFVGAGRVEEVAFVRGTTEAINLVAQSWGGRNLGPGDEILITGLEHHANLVPWQIVAQRTGAVLKVAPIDDDGNLLLQDFTNLLSHRTRIVAVTQVANSTGTVVPVEQLVELGHRAGARVLVDGAQSVAHLPVDLRTLGADFFVFSGHKIFGPTGIGALVVAERVWDETPAWQGGGNMIADVTHERSIYQGPPNKYEAGTGNIADAVGLAAALRYVREIGLERIAAYEHGLLEYAVPRLAAVHGVRLVGRPAERASVVSFVLDGHDPAEVGRVLNEHGVAVRAGHHCAQPTVRRLGHEQTVRASLAFYNTRAEIDLFVDVVRDLANGGTTLLR